MMPCPCVISAPLFKNSPAGLPYRRVTSTLPRLRLVSAAPAPRIPHKPRMLAGVEVSIWELARSNLRRFV